MCQGVSVVTTMLSPLLKVNIFVYVPPLLSDYTLQSFLGIMMILEYGFSPVHVW